MCPLQYILGYLGRASMNSSTVINDVLPFNYANGKLSIYAQFFYYLLRMYVTEDIVEASESHLTLYTKGYMINE